MVRGHLAMLASYRQFRWRLDNRARAHDDTLWWRSSHLWLRWSNDEDGLDLVDRYWHRPGGGREGIDRRTDQRMPGPARGARGGENTHRSRGRLQQEPQQVRPAKPAEIGRRRHSGGLEAVRRQSCP